MSDGTLFVDYTGSSPQVRGALNSTLSFTHSLTYLSVRCVLAKDVPNNVGLFRCIKVKAPEASVLNPVMPAPCAARALTGYRVFDTMLGALSQIVPDKVPAAGEGGNSVICISGLRPNRQPFIIVDMICGAWGGRPDKDGLEAVTNASQNLSNMPVEVMEAEHPVRIEDYAFVPDSCGAGQYRGGVGVRRSYRILAPEALLQMRTDRVGSAPYGLAGGEPGGPSRNFMEVGNERCGAAGQDHDDGRQGTLIIHEQAGAGGFGDPMLREPDEVREDLLDGKITAGFAERHYARGIRRARRAGRGRHRTAACRAQMPGAMVADAHGSLDERRHGPKPGRSTRNAGGQPRQDPGCRQDRIRCRMASAARASTASPSRAGVNKNLIYHYFGSKDALYLAVLERIYADLRASQQDQDLRRLPPVEGMKRLVSNTFDHFVATPDLIRLMSIENIHYGAASEDARSASSRSIAACSTPSGFCSSAARKRACSGANVDPVDLYLSISGLAYFFLSNQHTLSWLLDRDLAARRRVLKAAASTSSKWCWAI